MGKRSPRTTQANSSSKVGAPTRTTLLLVLIWLIPVLLLSLGLIAKGVLEKVSFQPNLPETVVVGERSDRATIGVDVLFELGNPPEIHGHLQGIVTSVDIGEGDSPEPGMGLFKLDGSPKVAYAGSTPFFRELSLGMAGDDVATLTELLRTTGDLAPGELLSDFNYDVYLALMRFQERLGLPIDGYLRASDFVLVNPEVGRITELFLKLGRPYPNDGIIALGSGTINDVQIHHASDSSPIQPVAEAVILEASGRTFELPSTHFDASGQAELLSSLREWVRSGTIQAFDENGGWVRFSGITMSLAEPIVIGTVPNTAILVSTDGSTCVLKVSQEEKSVLEPIRTTIGPVGSEIGIAAVDRSLVGSSILRDASKHQPQGQSCQ